MAKLNDELLRRMLDAQAVNPVAPYDQSQAVEGTIKGLNLADTLNSRQKSQEDRVRALKEKIEAAKLEAAKRAEEQAQMGRMRAVAANPRDAKLRAEADPSGEMKFVRELELQKMKDASDLARSKATLDQKAGMAQPAKTSEFAKERAKTITSKVDQALGKLNYKTTGVVGQVMSKIGGTDARNLRGDLETIKANLGFQQLQEMREASKTGGALGQVAVQELEALQSAVSSLDQAQDNKQLTNNLNEVKTRYNNWLKAYEAAQAEAGQAPGNMNPAQPTGNPGQMGGLSPEKAARLAELRAKKAAGTLGR